MEASSPLAAMQPSSALLGGHYGYRADVRPSYSHYANIKNFAPKSFNFKDLSMKASRADYFSMQPVRGSSPTASLAADLSQNFHIDQSPQLPTPRRALFSTHVLGGMNGRGTCPATTPPVPSSSPGPTSDSMDISPLPHKQPFNPAMEIEPQSPTPDLTPAEPLILSATSPLEPPAFQFPPIVPSQERRKSGPRRPSLSRAKGFSTSSIPLKLSAESQVPPFRFGNGIGVQKTASSSLANLSEAFDASPPQEKPTIRNNPLMLPPRPKQPFSGLSSATRNASPIGHVRKNSNPVVRPRKQFRRALSMFEHPEDVMNQDEAAPLPPIMDVEAPHVLQLPHTVIHDETNCLPRISKETLIEVLDGKFNHVYEKFVVIDCRFEYEYDGGHIDGAVNFNDKEQLSSQLFDVEPTSKALLIFHCEYSAHRAPIMAKFIRSKDRNVNAAQYPRLTYPEAYILDGGYSSFFKDYRFRCIPQNYVEMGAQEHSRACEKGLGKVKGRSKLIRAQTFAFGQQSSPSMDDSPTGISRIRHDSVMEVDSASSTKHLELRYASDPWPPRNRRMFSC